MTESPAREMEIGIREGETSRRASSLHPIPTVPAVPNERPGSGWRPPDMMDIIVPINSADDLHECHRESAMVATGPCV
jgi:hypothetical protein